MSAVVEDNIKDNEDSVKNQETPQEITGTIMEGNVPSIESNKIKTHVIGATSENNPQSLAKTILKLVNKESGDMNKDLLTEKLVKYDGTESQMAEQLKVPSVSEVNRGSGDFVATSISDETAISSKNITKAGEALDSGVTDKNDKNNDSSFDKCDEIDIKKADIDMDQTDEAEDTDDMQLRWDDDDGSDNVVKNNDNLTEEQLLEESLHNLDASKNAQDIETNLDSDILNENSTKMEIFTEKGNVISDNSINSELLKETDLNAESTQISNENIVDNSSKNEVLKELEIDIDISQDNLNNISTTEKETEQWPMALQKADNSAMDDGLTEDELLAEPENSVDKALESAKDFTVTENADDLTTEEKLLEETEVIQETDVSMEGGKDDLDKNKEILLENKVLQDIETNVKINIPLETEDAKKDEELLKDDESQYDSCTAMEVDNTFDCTDECIGHETEGEKKDMNETIEDQAKVTKKDNQLPTDHQSAALDINREESNVEVVVDKDKVDQPIDDQNREKALEIGEDTNKPKQTVASTIDTMTESNKSDVLIAVLQKTPEKEVEIRLEPIESTNQDNTLNTSISEETAVNTSTKLEDSLIDIKTDHGLHKPDVMLEIPTQELIDMDDTDLSINLDNSKDEDIIQESTVDEEKTVDQEAIVTAPAVDQVNTEDGNTVLEQNKVDDNRIRDLVVQETIEESLERMFADDEAAIPKEVVECITTTSQITDPPKAIPSTCTKMTPDTSDEVPEVSDSLGLLAESAGRLMEDDEDDDVDDDDDFDQDESSNQISAEQSEDSNPAALEAETVVEEEKELDTPDPKDEQFQYMICDLDAPDKEEEKMEIQIEAFGTVELQAETINDEAKTAVDALLKNSDEATTEAVEDPQDTDQMDIETVKLSDTSDNEVEVGSTQVDDIETTKPSQDVIEEQQDTSKQTPSKQSPVKQLAEKSRCKQSPAKQSPSKMSKLEITPMEANKVVNIVDLEESSSSEDDIQVVAKEPEPEPPLQEKSPSPSPDGVTNVNIPTSIDIMCTSGGNTSAIVTKDGETVISGIPKAPPHRPARLNTSEVSIKTASNTEPLVIPETKINENGQTETQTKPKLGLEIFSLDSDDDESAAKEQPVVTSPQKMTALELEKARETSKCINYCCTSGSDVPYKVADMTTVAYYDAGRKRRSMVCQPCADVVANRTKKLMEGIKNFSPLLDLDMAKLSQDLVEISDSESEDEEVCPEEPKETIGEKGAKLIEENLAQLLNETWHKYDMDTRLKETQIMLDDEIEKLEQDSKEIDAMLNECQVATDKLRSDLYAAFTYQKQELQPITLYDTPNYKYFGPETDPNTPNFESQELQPRKSKRRLSSTSETPAKRPAIPLGYAPLDVHANKQPKPINAVIENRIDDDKDISVVKLSAEAAPAGLPPPGEISHPPLRVGMPVFAMKNAFGPWLKGRVLEIQPKVASMTPQFTLCRVKFDHKTKTNGKILPARCLAYAEPADVRMTIGTRLIALFKDANKRESYYSGVVAEIPNPVNNYRYLVFFDDGYAQYVQHAYTRVVCESSSLVWEEVHPFSRDFVREYLMTYPERPMVRLHEGQHLKTEWNGKWWSSRVIRVDASLAQVMFVGDGRREWIYRGSTRLAPLYLELRAAERHRPRPMPRSKAQPRSNMPYVEYTRSDEPETPKETDVQPQQQQQQQFEEIRRQRAVAKKSTSVPAPPPPQQPVTGSLDTVTSRVVYYTPKNAVKPYKMTPHRCGPKCKRNDVLSLKELRTYNPLAKPLLSGWERQIVRFKGHKEVMYRAPCGRRVRSMRELHKYLLSTDSELPVDLFDFHYATHCLAEFVLNKCRVGKKDLSHGKENVPVPCVNYYDDSLPEFCSYNTERTPTAGVPLNLDPEFLCGCDCTDDCQDKSKCACWKMTLEGARTIGLHGPNLGYVYKRLPEPLPSGIYECNSRCKCKHTCLNRVAQHPLQLKLQVFKTLNRGWGIRALNDVPKGSFLCVYAGNLLTDATANLDGLNEGDEYLAELDYIEVVEQMKEGYEEDIPEADKKLDKKDQKKDGEDTDDPEPSSSEDEEAASKTDKEDDDFRPGYVGLGDAGNNEFSKRLRRRERSKKAKDDTGDEKDKEKEKDKDTKEANAEEDCITISDDEEVREPSRFTVQAGMGANEFISKYKSVRTLFGKDEACYIMDAKVQGNIGRYLNHSCCPNVFVQNVFVDTHDPRFPWVAFFALSHIKAGTELTWNYNYDVGSVPGKVLYCYCGAPNCRGRLL